METVFDHNITKEELEAVLGSSKITRNKLLSFGSTQEHHYASIYRLYIYRGNRVIAQKYADLLPNNIHKVFGTCNHDFAIIRDSTKG